MTLNGHFALKSGPSSASNGLALWLSEKTAWKFAYTVSGNKKFSPASDCTGDISVMGLFIGVIRRGSVKPVNCIQFTQFSHMPFTVTDVCRKISKIQE